MAELCHPTTNIGKCRHHLSTMSWIIMNSSKLIFRKPHEEKIKGMVRKKNKGKLAHELKIRTPYRIPRTTLRFPNFSHQITQAERFNPLPRKRAKRTSKSQQVLLLKDQKTREKKKGIADVKKTYSKSQDRILIAYRAGIRIEARL